MNLEKWELAYCPSEKDRNRWRVKLRIEERELMSLLNGIPGTVGRPLLLENDEYSFGFYVYEISGEEVTKLRALLEGACPHGAFLGPSKEEALDTMLEKMAQGLENLGDGAAENSAKKAAPAPPEEPPVPRAAPPREEAPADGAVPVVSRETRASFQDLNLNERYTFDEFIIGPNNRFTAAAAQAVADNPGKIYNPFFIYGGVGLGKTHLMHAVGHYVRKKNSNVSILYVTTEKFMSEVIDSIRRGTLQQMRDHYREVDLLLVDDIQFLVESESTQEEFFHTFNVLHQNGKQIIITSDRPPKQLTTLEDRLRSRFEWGLIADIKSPNLETRVAILKKKEEHEHLKLDDNILLYIASKLKSNIRELEGFLKRINAYAALTHQDVNMELVQSIMSDLLPEEEQAEAAPPSFAHPAPAVPPAPVYSRPVAPAPPVTPKPPAPPPVAPPPAAPPRPVVPAPAAPPPAPR
ncbi:MAG: chromosomal replication initiator protein DnaA, partial [Endomicrobiales bacterium]